MNPPLTPLQFLYRGRELYGSRLAVVSGEDRFTYTQFLEHCEGLAGGLKRLGVKAGERIAYLSFNTYQLLAGYFGPPLAGAVFMPLNVRLTPAELTGMIWSSGACVLLFEQEFAQTAERLRRNCPSLRATICLDGPTYEELLAPPSFPDPIDENAAAGLFFTSGSTADPKPVELSHRMLYLHALAMNEALPQTPVELHAVPLYHANGWGRPHTATMHGATHVLLRRFRPADVFELISREGVTGTSLVPVMAQTLLDSGWRPGSLEELHLGGAPVAPGLIDELTRVLQCRVTAGYGLTEAGPVVAVAAGVHEKSLIYSPIPGVETRIEEGGELFVRSEYLPWLGTGDMAVAFRECSFRIVDRIKDVIISGGENISSVEVEAAIDSHPAVLECAVIAAPDPKWGEMPCAIVVLRPGQKLSQDELLAFLNGRLARFKIPRTIQMVAGPLPRTATGKLRKRELRNG